MPECTPENLAELSACFTGLSPDQHAAIQTYLLCLIAGGVPSSDAMVYRAILNQSGTSAPVATVLENTLGGTVIWARTNVGAYEGQLAGSFPVNGTIISQQSWSDWTNLAAINVSVAVPGQVNIDTFDISGFPVATPADTILSQFSIAIWVYP